jgi:hypothetical protein
MRGVLRTIPDGRSRSVVGKPAWALLVVFALLAVYQMGKQNAAIGSDTWGESGKKNISPERSLFNRLPQDHGNSMLGTSEFLYIGAEPCSREEKTPACIDECQQMLKIVLQQRADSRWNDYYLNVVSFLKKRNLESASFAEIGVAYGGLASTLVTNLPSLQYHAVDPFFADYDNNDLLSRQFAKMAKESPARWSNYWARALQFNLKHLADASCRSRVHFHHMSSIDAAARFQRRTLDVVFIDGLHSRRGIDDDIAAWMYVVRPGGYMIFNDYGNPEYPGIKPAVDGFAAAIGSQTEMLDDQSNVFVYVPNVIPRNLQLARGDYQ